MITVHKCQPRAFLFQAADGGTDRMTGDSNATPSGSFASSQRSAMCRFSKTFKWPASPTSLLVSVNPDCFHLMILTGLAFFRGITGEGRLWFIALSIPTRA